MSTLYDITRSACLTVILCAWTTLVVRAQEYEVEKAPFNSQHADFGAVRYKDGVVFCSNRMKKKLSFDEDSTNFYTDMFWCKMKSNNSWSSPEIFSAELTDYLNEGPATFTSDEKTVYYTSNYHRLRPNKKERVDEYVLGIQAATLVNGIWTKTDFFPFNAPKTDYNVAHPALAPGDSLLYFSSNMPGGQGGMDLYKCVWRNGRWSQPINLGSGINTKGDELFPYVSGEGLLYYTTNGHSDKNHKNTDIYVCEIIPGGHSEAFPLPYPVNTEYDDFAYAEYNGSESGMISTNREEMRDMIYTFRMTTPKFNDCGNNERPVFCYTIEDLRITPIDSLPLVYEWELGDGSRKRGLSVEHCYPGPGEYKIALNIIDSISNATFFAVSEATLEIPDIQQPFILSSDTVLTGQHMNFFADLSGINKFRVDKIHWVIDNKHLFTGDTLPYAFSEPGYHSVICGVVGKIGEGGRRPKTCAYKEILVLNDPLPGFPKPDPDPREPAVMKIKMRNNFNPFTTKTDAKLAPVYQIVLAQSNTRLKFDHPIFEKKGFEITESQDESGDYIYTIGQSKEIQELFPLYQKLQESGYRAARVEVFNEPTLAGVDWQSFRNQGMVAAEAVTETSPLERRLPNPEPEIRVPALPGNEQAVAAQSERTTEARTLDLPGQTNQNSRSAPFTGADPSAQPQSDGASAGSPGEERMTMHISDTNIPATGVAPNSPMHGEAEQMTAGSDQAHFAASPATGASVSTGPDGAVTPATAMASSPGHPVMPEKVAAQQETQATHTGFHTEIPQASGIQGQAEAGEEGFRPHAAAGVLPEHEAERSMKTGASAAGTEAPVHAGEQQAKAQHGSTEQEGDPAGMEQPASLTTQTSAPSGNQTQSSPQTGGPGRPDGRVAPLSQDNKQASADKELYHVIIIESPYRIPMNDPFFSRISHEIVEIESAEGGYAYAVGLSNNSSGLEALAGELRANGYTEARVHSFRSAELQTRIVRKGTYIPPGDAERLNIEFSKLRDIKFAYNSAEILEESKANLDYVAAMLLLENDFELKINAHTCSIGGREFNMELSAARARSVEEYLKAKGINASRLHSKGFADTLPVADNSTESGRRQNRRVEFIIVFNTLTQKQ